MARVVTTLHCFSVVMMSFKQSTLYENAAGAKPTILELLSAVEARSNTSIISLTLASRHLAVVDASSTTFAYSCAALAWLQRKWEELMAHAAVKPAITGKLPGLTRSYGSCCRKTSYNGSYKLLD